MSETPEPVRGLRWIGPQVVISCLMLILLVLCALTYNRYGFTTDEQNGLVRARHIFDFFAGGGVDDRDLTAMDPRKSLRRDGRCPGALDSNAVFRGSDWIAVTSSQACLER